MELDGRRLAFEELVNACQVMPFLMDRRLVVVRDLLQRFEGARPARGRGPAGEARTGGDDEFAQRLVAYLPQMPPSTRLLFAEAATLSKSNPIVKAALQRKDGFVKEFLIPSGGALHDWVRRRAAHHGVSITREATDLLTASVGPSLRQLDQELAKLAAHGEYRRAIEEEDVRTLVHAAQQSDIFGLVDSLGARQRGAALRRLHELLADRQNELYLLTMVARQVRLILAAKELVDEGGMGVDEVRRELKLSHRFIAEKLVSQARIFRMEELEALLRRVAEVDQAIKTGQIEGTLALELLIVESCRRTPSEGGQSPGRHQPSRSARTR
jgi:DNA polymerase-3 subunit delta